jgi:hypothetical protein
MLLDPDPYSQYGSGSRTATKMIKTTIFDSFRYALMSLTKNALPFKFDPSPPPEIECDSRSGICRIRNVPTVSRLFLS